jgi:hypothetical protein
MSSYKIDYSRMGEATNDRVNATLSVTSLTSTPDSRIAGCASPKCAMTAEAGGRNVDRMQQPCCIEDGGRPSGGGLQDQPSNRPALRGDKVPGGERTGKRRA